MKINGRDVSNESKLTVFGGVNVIESDDLLLSVAEKFKKLSDFDMFHFVDWNKKRFLNETFNLFSIK